MSGKRINLTRGRLFCLRELAEREQCSWTICKKAKDAGVQETAQYTYEWADKHILFLRRSGLIEKTGQRSEYGRAIHRITDAGKAALAGTEART